MATRPRKSPQKQKLCKSDVICDTQVIEANNPKEGTGVSNITFQAIFNKATTTLDGGWNVTLSLPSSEALQVTQLATLTEQLLQVAIIPL